MSVPAAFLSVVIIWSTTPLAIQWSSQGWGFLFGVTGRMAVGASICVALVLLSGKKLPLERKALETYIAAGAGIYGAMMAVYWGSQYIPSGLVAVLFGLTPMVTAVLAAFFLQEASLSAGKILGALLGVAGLSVIFAGDIGGQPIAWQGVVAMLVSVAIHCFSAVWIKRINGSYPALAITTGGLLVSVPLYLATWLLLDGSVPAHFELRNSGALLYLGVFGSVLGFSLYFYILKNMEANRVALIPLITPVAALLIGHLINDEAVSSDVWTGAFCIIAALAMHQWGDVGLQYLKTLLVPAKRID